MYTVSLQLPDLAEKADFPDREPTPIDAVEAFQSAVMGSPDLYVYVVTHEDGREWHVDMAGGPSIKESI